MAPKACTVIVHDLNDTAHQLEVTADTLYEAVAQALAMVRGHDWVGDIATGLITVTNRGCKSPADTVLKTLESWRPRRDLNPCYRRESTRAGRKLLKLRNTDGYLKRFQ
jgi:hypothetical protein